MGKRKPFFNNKSNNNTKRYKHNDSYRKQTNNYFKDIDIRTTELNNRPLPNRNLKKNNYKETMVHKKRGKRISRDVEKSPLVHSLMESSYTWQIVQAFRDD